MAITLHTFFTNYEVFEPRRVLQFVLVNRVQWHVQNVLLGVFGRQILEFFERTFRTVEEREASWIFGSMSLNGSKLPLANCLQGHPFNVTASIVIDDANELIAWIRI